MGAPPAKSPPPIGGDLESGGEHEKRRRRWLKAGRRSRTPRRRGVPPLFIIIDDYLEKKAIRPFEIITYYDNIAMVADEPPLVRIPHQLAKPHSGRRHTAALR